MEPLFNVNVKICLVYMIRTLCLLSSEISTIIQGKAFRCELIFYNMLEGLTNLSWFKKNIECLVAYLRIDYKTLFTITKKENLHQLRDFSKRQPWGNGTLFQLKSTYLYNLFERMYKSLWEIKGRFEYVVPVSFCSCGWQLSTNFLSCSYCKPYLFACLIT